MRSILPPTCKVMWKVSIRSPTDTPSNSSTRKRYQSIKGFPSDNRSEAGYSGPYNFDSCSQFAMTVDYAELKNSTQFPENLRRRSTHLALLHPLVVSCLHAAIYRKERKSNPGFRFLCRPSYFPQRSCPRNLYRPYTCLHYQFNFDCLPLSAWRFTTDCKSRRKISEPNRIAT